MNDCNFGSRSGIEKDALLLCFHIVGDSTSMRLISISFACSSAAATVLSSGMDGSAATSSFGLVTGRLSSPMGMNLQLCLIRRSRVFWCASWLTCHGGEVGGFCYFEFDCPWPLR